MLWISLPAGRVEEALKILGILAGFIFVFILVGRYIQNNIWDAYLCVPRLGQYLSRKEIQQLLEQETFVKVEDFRDVTLQNKVFESEHWLKIKDRYIAKNLVIAFWTWADGPSPNGYFTPYFMYMTGDTFNVSVVDGEELERDFLNRSLNVPNFYCNGKDKKIYRQGYEAYILEHPKAAVENKQCILEPSELRTTIIKEILTAPGNLIHNRRYFLPPKEKRKRAHIKMERNQKRRDARRK
ncbi:hypothetical protein [Eubacterium sp. 1001713B170207_170306_E7]|uniref:hypothetical protein n=1 Tax=Eubacterium sp. 1001713B170207_170306_E7 TaxID=2787097 RepID=UPI00189BE964|nr:hypothetical protein [Eubacterium sp. 1001713B170207_170306_E7]